MPAQATPPPVPPDYDAYAIFDPDGPINPVLVTEAIRALMRALPLDPSEPVAWANRRMYCAIVALAALHPRDEIEVMLAVQAISAYHAATAGWHLAMNHHKPHGDSTRHLSAAATAARTFDTLLKALERRQAKPLSVPVGRPLGRVWQRPDLAAITGELADRCRDEPPAADNDDQPTWSTFQIAAAEAMQQRDLIEQETEGLDLADTPGILPGGGMIVPDNPTLKQEIYLGRRIGIQLRKQWAENQRNGINKLPEIPRLRPGDLVP